MTTHFLILLFHKKYELWYFMKFQKQWLIVIYISHVIEVHKVIIIERSHITQKRDFQT